MSNKDYWANHKCTMVCSHIRPENRPPSLLDINNLTAQLILLFYGTEALQEYRQDKDLVPVAVYQAVKLIEELLLEAIANTDPSDEEPDD